MRIDAHHHLWQPLRGDYDWMPKDVAVLNRAYTPADLAPELAAGGIDGTVLVQAAATVHETEYMLGLADGCDWIRGVVGWIDFERRDDLAHLVRLSAHPKFKGVRPMIQDIPDVDWMLREEVQWAFRALCDLGLTFDALGFPQHIANFLAIAKRYPGLRIVYDHGMKPQIADLRAGRDPFPDWAEGMARLADETTGCCKLSALVTEAAADWTAAEIEPFAEHILAVFGPERVMWGSDWPVCRNRLEYGDWLALAEGFTARLGAEAWAQVFGGTAIRFYGLT